MISYIKKDVTTVTKGIIVHGCNCQGVMGSGVAKAIRDKWPGAFVAYRSWCELHGLGEHHLLGGVVWYHVNDVLHIANALTQHFYGKDGKRYAEPRAIAMALHQVTSFAEGVKLPIYMPRIGCGLGGLDWDENVQPFVEVLSNDRSVDIYVCDL